MDYNYSTKQAFFNAAMGSVIRLDNLLNRCLNACHAGQYNDWHLSLISIINECWPKWNDKIREKAIQLTNDAMPELSTFARMTGNEQNPNPRVVQSIFQKLITAERYIRDEADKVGLLNPNKATIMDGMGDVD